jgi:hypothetical protein
MKTPTRHDSRRCLRDLGPLVSDPGPAAAAHPYIDPRSLNPHYLARPMNRTDTHLIT